MILPGPRPMVAVRHGPPRIHNLCNSPTRECALRGLMVNHRFWAEPFRRYSRWSVRWANNSLSGSESWCSTHPGTSYSTRWRRSVWRWSGRRNSNLWSACRLAPHETRRRNLLCSRAHRCTLRPAMPEQEPRPNPIETPTTVGENYSQRNLSTEALTGT